MSWIKFEFIVWVFENWIRGLTDVITRSVSVSVLEFRSTLNEVYTCLTNNHLYWQLECPFPKHLPLAVGIYCAVSLTNHRLWNWTKLGANDLCSRCLSRVSSFSYVLKFLSRAAGTSVHSTAHKHFLIAVSEVTLLRKYKADFFHVIRVFFC